MDVRLHTTANHPWLTTDRGWVHAGDLRPGEPVVTLPDAAGNSALAATTTATVAWVRGVPGAGEMDNLTVAKDHTYAVGASQAVVHNTGCLPTQTPKEYDIIEYGQDAPGLEKHHGIMDAWAKDNIASYPGVRPSDSPTIALSPDDHSATKAVYREWLRARTGRPVGVAVDWNQVSAPEIYDLSERMFDAANVPRDARSAYYSAFNQYIYTGSFIPVRFEQP